MNGAFYHVHWYKYPLTYWLNIITSLGCLEGGDRISLIFLKLTPRTDSSLTTILNPEAVIFANPIAQGPAQQMPLPVPLICLSMFCSGVPVRRAVCTRSMAG
ncbi:hypothetical protein DMH20_27360 [Escherichia coli]|nr:hypothetical protein [Escherichia coli]